MTEKDWEEAAKILYYEFWKDTDPEPLDPDEWDQLPEIVKASWIRVAERAHEMFW